MKLLSARTILATVISTAIVLASSIALAEQTKEIAPANQIKATEGKIKRDIPSTKQSSASKSDLSEGQENPDARAQLKDDSEHLSLSHPLSRHGRSLMARKRIREDRSAIN